MCKYYANLISWSAVIINFTIITLITLYGIDYHFYLIGFVIAGLFDMFDGKVARKYNRKKEEKIMGELTDSLCDVINFGVFPILVYLFVHINTDNVILLLISGSLFLWAGIFRLARFSAIKIEGGYQGLPITIAGPITVLIIILFSNVYISTISIIICALLMVSKIKVKKI